MKRTDMALSDALHKWWSAFKRAHPDAVPSPADAFREGFIAARKVYIAGYLEGPFSIGIPEDRDD